MTLHRFFACGPLADEGALPLSPSDVHHIRDVLRLAAGDRIVVVDGTGAAVVRLTDVTGVVAGVRERALPVVEVPPVVLAQAVPKGDRMEMVIRQATEVGVSRVIPFTSERCVVRMDSARAHAKAERWRRIAGEAAKQSQRTDVPEVSDPVSLAALPALLEGAVVLVCWEDAGDARGIGQVLDGLDVAPDSVVAVVIGPEGGLSSGEVALLEAHGAWVVTLGATLLRTDTAGLIASALVLYERGSLGGRRD
jgi:16S rRNA (uracil1498-N3)-methyltransferase